MKNKNKRNSVLNENQTFNIGAPGGSEGKESACSAGSVPGSGLSPGEGNGNPLSTLAWKIPWMEEPGGLQTMGSQRVVHDSATSLNL